MSEAAQIRAELEILGAQGVDDLRNRLTAAKAESGELAAALGRGELSAAEFDAESKRVAASVRNLESAIADLDRAERQRQAGIDKSIDSLGRQIQEEIKAAQAAEQLAQAKADEAKRADLAHAAEMESAAIQHEIEMLAHEERQLRAWRPRRTPRSPPSAARSRRRIGPRPRPSMPLRACSMSRR